MDAVMNECLRQSAAVVVGYSLGFPPRGVAGTRVPDEQDEQDAAGEQSPADMLELGPAVSLSKADGIRLLAVYVSGSVGVQMAGEADDGRRNLDMVEQLLNAFEYQDRDAMLERASHRAAALLESQWQAVRALADSLAAGDSYDAVELVTFLDEHNVRETKSNSPFHHKAGHWWGDCCRKSWPSGMRHSQTGGIQRKSSACKPQIFVICRGEA